jgi:ribosomal protein L12E/L44/L45/RPP1/RPP2
MLEMDKDKLEDKVKDVVNSIGIELEDIRVP